MHLEEYFAEMSIDCGILRFTIYFQRFPDYCTVLLDFGPMWGEGGCSDTPMSVLLPKLAVVGIGFGFWVGSNFSPTHI